VNKTIHCSVFVRWFVHVFTRQRGSTWQHIL